MKSTESAATFAAYTPADRESVDIVKKWLADHAQSRSFLSTKSTIPSGTISQILNGKYPSSPSKQLAQMRAALAVETERMTDGTPGYIEGSVHKLVFVVCDRTRKHANFGLVVGNVGIGKTRTLKEYRARKHQTLLVEADPKMSPGELLVDLLEQLGTATPHGLGRKFHAVVKALQGSQHLILVDEAENLSAQSLHYLRRIRDKAEVGVVLSGTTKLHALIKPEQGQFDQIRSRVSMWPETIKTISRDDMDDMARASLLELGEVTDEVLDALWDLSGGSARVLTEGLLPTVKDYIGTNTLSAKLVETIAKKALFMTRRVGVAA